MGLDYEFKYYNDEIRFIVGCDEAGRGPLAGPVVAAACILPSNYHNDLIDDSKKLSDGKRRKLFKEITEVAVAYGVGIVEAQEIDQINIYQASKLAMNKAIANMQHKYDLVITDAMPLYGLEAPVEPVIKGDAKALCVAAASIIAKVTRDDLMIELDNIYPQYGFKNHKGYGTREHLDAIDVYGPIVGIHRFSFDPVLKKDKKQLTLF
ncbi:MAG: ribonuclease HII [Bacilli bacterium]|nr:ribonuclease HII [Bacilli bacterium]